MIYKSSNQINVTVILKYIPTTIPSTIQFTLISINLTFLKRVAIEAYLLKKNNNELTSIVDKEFNQKLP